MDQKDLAAALGISPGLVSRLKRRGMPVHSVEAARAWRMRNVNPYAKGHPAPARLPAAPPPAMAPQRPAKPLPSVPMSGDVFVEALGDWSTDALVVLENIAMGFALLPNGDALAMARALGAAADELLAQGRPLGAMEAPLRLALRLVPGELRDPLPVSVRVMDALIAEVREAVEARYATEQDRQADRDALRAAGPDAAQAMGAFWYRVAAGEATLLGEEGATA